MDLSNLAAKVYELLTVYGMKVIAAIIIFIVGRWVAKGVAKLLRRVMTKSKTDETLVKFVGSLAYIALLAFVIIAALNHFRYHSQILLMQSLKPICPYAMIDKTLFYECCTFVSKINTTTYRYK